MKSLVFLIAAALLTASFSAPAWSAADGMKVIILGDHQGPDALPRNSPTFQRAFDALSDRLHRAGYRIFDTRLVMPDAESHGGVEPMAAEILERARVFRRPPLDVAVVFSIHANATDLAYASRITTRITGQILHLGSGRQLDTFQIQAPVERPALGACGRRCLLRIVARSAEDLSRTLGSRIAARLGPNTAFPAFETPSPTGRDLANGYTLLFDGFGPEELADVTDYLEVFGGYRRHQLVRLAPQTQELWYETISPADELEGNLGKMLHHLRLRGRISLSGSVFTLKNTATSRPVGSQDW